MAIMEAPAIVVGVVLLNWLDKRTKKSSVKELVIHSMVNGSVVLLVGSLGIGLLTSEDQAEGVKPFTDWIFKGFLMVFLLDKGIAAGKKLNALRRYGWFPYFIAIILPLINGVVVALVSSLVSDQVGNRFLFAVLAASASYIAVPAAMKLANPRANAGLYLPMSLAITFPFNITLGFPIYFFIVQNV